MTVTISYSYIFYEQVCFFDTWKYQLQDTGFSIEDFDATGFVKVCDDPIGCNPEGLKQSINNPVLSELLGTNNLWINTAATKKMGIKDGARVTIANGGRHRYH